MRSFLTFILLLSIYLGYSQKGVYHVLFIGNSLTYTNDLPKLVRLEAAKTGLKVKTRVLAFPNYAIEDHWNDGEVQKLLKTGKYDYLILQQGPSSQQEGRKMLVETGALLKKLCAQSNTELVYFMVWPSRKYYSTFNGVIKNYSEAAEQNKAILCPVGVVWKEHFDHTNDYSYYGMDGFHPSLRGSQIAAEVIASTLFTKKAIN